MRKTDVLLRSLRAAINIPKGASLLKVFRVKGHCPSPSFPEAALTLAGSDLIEIIKRVNRMEIETERLFMRELKQSDFEDLFRILQDEEVMYAYEGAFNDTQAQEWLDKQISRYKNDSGLGLLAVILKENGEMIGQCGLTLQDCIDKKVIEVGYLFQKAYWHKGYAIEAARACKEYAFNVLKAEEVFSIIRDTNIPSQRVAERNGMTRRGEFVKHYRGVDMPHFIYSVKRSEI